MLFFFHEEENFTNTRQMLKTGKLRPVVFVCLFVFFCAYLKEQISFVSLSHARARALSLSYIVMFLTLFVMYFIYSMLVVRCLFSFRLTTRACIATSYYCSSSHRASEDTALKLFMMYSIFSFCFGSGYLPDLCE